MTSGEPMTPNEAAVIAEFLGDAEMNEWERRGDLPHVVAMIRYFVAEVEDTQRVIEADALMRAADRLGTGIRCLLCLGFARADESLRMWAHEKLQERP